MLRTIIFSLTLALSIYARQCLTTNIQMLYDPWLRNNELFNLMFPNQYFIQTLHILGALFAFWSALLLKGKSVVAFLLLLFDFVIPTPSFDPIYAFISFNFFVVTISVNCSSIFIKLICNIVSGVSVAGCILIVPELYPLALLSFFSYLFFWLRTHNISTPNLKLFIDAIQTFVSFVVSFIIAFIIELKITSAPKISKEIYPLRKILFVFPGLRSKMFIISLACFFSNHHPVTKLLYSTLFLSALIFRVKPITSQGADLTLCIEVSRVFYHLGALFVISNSDSNTFMFLTVPLYLFVLILGVLFNF